MTKEEAMIKRLKEVRTTVQPFRYVDEAIDYAIYAIEALKQEPRKDEVILTNKEYRELIANEYEHGYCKGYAVALEGQEPILDKIRAEIEEHAQINQNLNTERARALCWCLDVIDKHKAEIEPQESEAKE